MSWSKTDWREKCPVCDSPMKVEKYYVDGYLSPVCEEYHTCPKKDFAYEYAYGSTRVTVGKKEFGGFYLDTPEKVENRDKLIEKEIKKIKDFNRNCKVVLSVLAALVIPGGLVLVPLYHWLKKKRAQSKP